MSLFPLTPDKLGPLICKRINRLTLFARAQKQGTRTVTRMQAVRGSSKVPRPIIANGSFLLCGAVQPLQVCRRHICDYDSHKAGTLIDYSDALSRASSGKGFSGLLFNGPRVSNKSRMCFSRATATRGGREKKEQDRGWEFTNSSLTWMESEGQKLRWWMMETFIIKDVWINSASSSVVLILQTLPLQYR